MQTVNIELQPILSGVLQVVSYMVLAVFAENVVLARALGYVFAVYIVREGRRRLRSKAGPSIFQGLPSSMIYIGVLSLAIYALVGHTVVL